MKVIITWFLAALITFSISAFMYIQTDTSKIEIKKEPIKIETEKKTTTVESVVSQTTTSDNTWIWIAVIALVLLVIFLGFFIGRKRSPDTTVSRTETTVKKNGPT